MVRATGPLMSVGAQKQLGKSLIFKQRGAKSFITGYNKPGGKNPSPPSALQLDRRMIYNLIIARWQSFSDGEKATWNNDPRTDTLNISGWNLFYQQSSKDLPQYLGLIAYWSFNKMVNGTILDLSGNNNTATPKPSFPSNSPQLVDSIGSKFGKAESLDGIDDNITIANGASVKGLSKVSVEFWFKPSDLNGAFQQIYFESTDAGNSTARFVVQITDSNFLRFGGRAPDGDGFTAWVTGTIPLTEGAWHHVVAVFDSVSDLHHLYLNGVDESDTVVEPALSNVAPTLIMLGAQGDGTSLPFKGQIDEVRVYNRVLSATEIQKHYKLISKK